MRRVQHKRKNNVNFSEKIILSIETSCDDTAISIVAARTDDSGNIAALNILAHEVESQIEIHMPFGGVGIRRMTEYSSVAPLRRSYR